MYESAFSVESRPEQMAWLQTMLPFQVRTNGKETDMANQNQNQNQDGDRRGFASMDDEKQREIACPTRRGRSLKTKTSPPKPVARAVRKAAAATVANA